MTTRFRDLVQPARAKVGHHRFRPGLLLSGLERQFHKWGQRTKIPSDELSGKEDSEPSERPSLDVSDLINELDFSDGMTKQELLRLRRQFAKANHPDAHPHYRFDYEERMKLANQLIDERIRTVDEET